MSVASDCAQLRADLTADGGDTDPGRIRARIDQLCGIVEKLAASTAKPTPSVKPATKPSGKAKR